MFPASLLDAKRQELMMRSQMEVWRMLDPQGFERVVEQFKGMDRDSYVSMLREEAARRGIDLDAAAARLGVKL